MRERINKAIIKAYEAGYRAFLVGGTQGGDMYALEQLLYLREETKYSKLLYPDIKIYAILPGDDQAEDWPQDMRIYYKNIIAKCDDVAYASDICTRESYLKRNRTLVNHSSRLIAIWEGRNNGGTAYTVRYAREKGVEVVRIPYT